LGNAKDALGIDIGASSVKLVYGRRVGDGFRVVFAEGLPLTDEAGVTGEGQGVQALVSEALRRRGLRPGAVVCAIDRSAATVRLLSLPPAGDEDIDRMVRFEAESHVPFPLANAEFSHLRLPSTNGHQSAMIAACPKATVASRRDLLTQAGAAPSEIAVSTVASFNGLFRTDLEIRSGTHLIVDLGAETTEVAVVCEGRLVSSLTLAQGGRTLTLSLARDKGWDVAQAEVEKREHGVPLDALGGLPDDPELFSTVAWFQKLYTGLERAAASHLSAYPGYPAGGVVLLGGGALLPGLASGLQASLKLPVRYADPLRALEFTAEDGGVSGASTVNLVTATGLAMQGVGLAAIQLDLTPREIIDRKRAVARRGMGWAAVSAFVVILAAASVWQGWSVYQANQAYQAELGRLRDVQTNMRDVRLTDPEKAALQWIVARGGDPKSDPLDLLALFSERLPLGVSLRDVTYRRGESISLKGLAESNEVLSEAVLALKGSDYFKDVRLTHSTATDVGGITLYTFDIECLPEGGGSP